MGQWYATMCFGNSKNCCRLSFVKRFEINCNRSHSYHICSFTDIACCVAALYNSILAIKCRKYVIVICCTLWAAVIESEN